MRMTAGLGGLLLLSLTYQVLAADRRAPQPKYAPNQFDGVFYPDVAKAIQGSRPSVRELQGAAAAAPGATAKPAPGAAPDAAAGASGWGAIIRPASLEDEIKRLKLQYDNTISTPAAFKSGAFNDARRDLTALAMHFTIIAQHPGQVRWKESAPAARDLLARTASNCKAGSAQVFNEAKQRKQDLQDLLSGTGLATREAAEDADWGTIVDRTPLMQYLDGLTNSLKEHSANDKSVESANDEVVRLTECVAAIGDVLVGSGMTDAEDGDYKGLSQRMKAAAIAARDAAARKDGAAFRTAIGAMNQSCDACHEQYR